MLKPKSSPTNPFFGFPLSETFPKPFRNHSERHVTLELHSTNTSTHTHKTLLCLFISPNSTLSFRFPIAFRQTFLYYKTIVQVCCLPFFTFVFRSPCFQSCPLRRRARNPINSTHSCPRFRLGFRHYFTVPSPIISDGKFAFVFRSERLLESPIDPFSATQSFVSALFPNPLDTLLMSC